MKLAISVFVASALAVSAAACATAPSDMAAGAAQAGEDCRLTVTPASVTPRKLCGTPEQWADYEQRIAALPSDVSCREMLVKGSNVIRMYCRTEDQWRDFERREAAAAQVFTLRLQGDSYNGAGF